MAGLLALSLQISKQAFEFYSDGSIDSLLEALSQLGFEDEVISLKEFTSSLEGDGR
ncbi:molecular chaperone TorD [Oligella ureolytica]